MLWRFSKFTAESCYFVSNTAVIGNCPDAGCSILETSAGVEASGGVLFVSVNTDVKFSRSVAHGNVAGNRGDFGAFFGDSKLELIESEINQTTDSVYIDTSVSASDSGCRAGFVGDCSPLGDSMYSCVMDTCKPCPKGTWLNSSGSLELSDCQS